MGGGKIRLFTPYHILLAQDRVKMFPACSFLSVSQMQDLVFVGRRGIARSTMKHIESRCFSFDYLPVIVQYGILGVLCECYHRGHVGDGFDDCSCGSAVYAFLQVVQAVGDFYERNDNRIFEPDSAKFDT